MYYANYKNKDYMFGNKENTLVFFKPDAIDRDLVCPITEKYIIVNDYRIVSIKPVVVTSELILEHYRENLEGHTDEILNRVLSFYLNKMIIILILEKENAINDFRRLVGTSDPSISPPGTIRGDFCDDSYELAEKEHRSCRNLVHASDSPSAFFREYCIWYQ